METLKLSSLTIITLTATLLTFGPAARAQSLLDVKIGTTSNDGSADGAYQESAAAVLGSGNAYWNEYRYVSSVPNSVSVVDSTGSTLSGVSLTVANSAGVGSLATTGNPGFLMNDMPYMNPGGIFTISIVGLLVNTEYQFVGYAAYPGLTLGASWAVTTGTFDTGTTSNTGTSADITSGVGVAYSDFYATTDGSGDLTITDSSLTSSYTVLSGFQLEAAAVPEPSAAAMTLCGGGILLAILRWRRPTTQN